MAMRKFLILFVFWVCGSALFAQENCNNKVTGYLLFSNDSTAVVNAEIFVENSHNKSRSDQDGFFQLRKICSGKVLLEIDMGEGGHIHQYVEINKDTLVLIYIVRNIIPLKNAQIISRKSNLNSLYSENLLFRNGMSFSSQITELPGIQLLRSGYTINKPVAEGMTGLRLPIYVNGVKLESQIWGNDHAPELDGTGYQKITRITGAATLARTHDALAGLIDIYSFPESHSGELDILTGLAYSTNGRQLAMFSKASGMPAGKKYSWHVNTNFRKGGNYNSPGYFLHNTGIEETGLNGGIKVRGQKNLQLWSFSFYNLNSGIFTGSRTGSIEDLKEAIVLAEPKYGKGEFNYAIQRPRQAVTHALTACEIQNKNHTIHLSAQFNNRREFDYHRSSENLFPQLDLYQWNVATRIDFNPAFSKNKHLKWGINTSQWIHQYGGYYFIPDFVANNTGSYLLVKNKIKSLHYELSIRGDIKYINSSWEFNGTPKQDEVFFGNIAGGISVKKENLKHHLQLNLLKLWRSPWVNELYSQGVHHAAAAYEQGNKNLRIENNYKISFEYLYYHRRLVFQTIGYANYIQNFINLEPAGEPVLTVRGAFPAYEYRQSNAIFTGLDAHFTWQITKRIKLDNRASYIYARNLSDNNYPSYIPTSWISAGPAFENKNFSLKLDYRQVFKQNYFTPGTDLLPPPAAYGLFGFVLSAKNLDKRQHFSFNIQGENILNSEYRDYLDRFRYFANLPGRNIYFRIIYNFHHHNENH